MNSIPQSKETMISLFKSVVSQIAYLRLSILIIFIVIHVHVSIIILIVLYISVILIFFLNFKLKSAKLLFHSCGKWL